MAPLSNPPMPLQRVAAASSNAVQCLHNMTSAQNAQWDPKICWQRPRVLSGVAVTCASVPAGAYVSPNCS